MSGSLPLHLKPDARFGAIDAEDADAPIEQAIWYTVTAPDAGLVYQFPAGALLGAAAIWADGLLDGSEMAVWVLSLHEGEGGPRFDWTFSALNQCAFRIRLPLEATNQNRWQYPRQGALLKPMAGGDRVDLARVDRMTLRCIRLGDRPARWCMTAFTATAEDPPPLARPALPRGPLLDELGQSTLRDWPARSLNAEEVTARLRAQRQAAAAQTWPAGWSRWGGDASRRLGRGGYFRTHHDGTRWWLLDPDGCAFWSAGMDCVAPNITNSVDGLEHAMTWLPPADGEYADAWHHPRRGHDPRGFNYGIANFIRAFGSQQWKQAWGEVALAELRRSGFNTVANWSDWSLASAADFSYVRPLEFSPRRAKLVFRDFPDVFDPAFVDDAADYARQLERTRDDRALIGYFLMNEPTWGFASMSPAEGMLLNPQPSHSHSRLLALLRSRGLEPPGSGGTIRAELRAALEEFSAEMVRRLFRTLSDACHAADPNHLNLGARYYTVPPPWALAGMDSFDVFSMNAYRERIPREQIRQVSEALRRPVMIGEWHLGAMDVGLPASGIGRVANQSQRGQAYRVYVEDAASEPACIGTHHFTLYDQSAVGRFDGECYNIGFLDVCHRPYEELVRAARASHERMYAVAARETAPYDEAPPYLPKLFL